MKETKKINKAIVIVIILLILIILSLIGYIIYEKIESDKTEQNQNTTSSTTTTNNEKNNNLTEKFVTFYDLGMKEHENYSKVFNIVLNNEKYNMVINNQFENLDDSCEWCGRYITTIKLNDKTVYTFESDTFTGGMMERIAIYDNKYIAIEEDVYGYDQLKNRKIIFLDYNNKFELNTIDIEENTFFENEYIYYYADSTEENKCSGKNMIINQYKTKINNNKFTEREKVKYLKELTVTCGEE
mgnify:FL=1